MAGKGLKLIFDLLVGVRIYVPEIVIWFIFLIPLNKMYPSKMHKVIMAIQGKFRGFLQLAV